MKENDQESFDNFHFKFFLFLALSFNQPQFCSTPLWNSLAITFANHSTVGTLPRGILITTNNTIYISHRENSQILVWYEGTNDPIIITSDDFSKPSSLFVTSNGDIYVDDENGRVQRWISQNKTWITAMNVTHHVGVCLSISMTICTVQCMMIIKW
jgi:hypothetical protein